MEEKVLLQDLAEQLAKAEGLQKNEASAFVRAFFETVIKGLNTDKYVKIKGFGTFKLVEVDSRESVNVNTGERFMIDSHAKISFVPDTVLREMVNKPFSHFATVILNDKLDDSELEEVNLKFETIQPAETELPVEEETVVEPAHTVSETKPMVEEAPIEQKQCVSVADENTTVEEAKDEDPLLVRLAIVEEAVQEEEPADSEAIAEEPVVQPVGQPVPSKGKTHVLLWMLLCMGCLAGGFFLGHFQVLPLKNNLRTTVIHDTVYRQKIVHDTIEVEKDATEEQVPEAPKAVKKTEPTAQVASQPAVVPVQAVVGKPQVKGGAYTIVGTKETYTLRDGETIRIVAERYYGSREMAPYIVAHNNISDPNLVAVGTVLKIPELKRKSE